MSDIGRNEPCPCGSGMKYKSCCLRTDEVELAKRFLEDQQQGAANLRAFEVEHREQLQKLFSTEPVEATP